MYQQQTQAITDYRQGHYDKAIQGFKDHPYNLGNALAHAGQIQEAIQSYAEALKQNPDDEDARFNKEYLEKQLPPQDQNSQNNQNNQDQQNQENSDQNDQEGQDNPDQQDQQNQDKESDEQQDSAEQQQDQPEQQPQPDQSEAEQQEQPQQIDENDKEKSPFNQDEQQVLNRLRTDPYRVLRYRLQQQARKQ